MSAILLLAALQLFAIELMLVQAVAVGNVQLGEVMQKIECDVTLAAMQLLPIADSASAGHTCVTVCNATCKYNAED